MSLTQAEAIARDVPQSADSLASFWRPRYWPAWVLVGWLRLVSLLPWKASIAVHRLIGDACWFLLPRRRRLVQQSMALGLPEATPDEIRKLTKRHFESLATCLGETAFAWFGRVDESLTHFQVEGAEHVLKALEAGHGVILHTGHFTPLEICAPILKETFPLLGFMYNHRRNGLINELQRRGRLYCGHISFPHDHAKTMLRALKSNAVVWYAPDQTFRNKGSLRLPFLGEDVAVNTGAYRIARASGAKIVPFSYYRLPDASGYMLKFDPPLDDEVAADEEQCTRHLLGVLERTIREVPDQYAWTPNRFRRRLS